MPSTMTNLRCGSTPLGRAGTRGRSLSEFCEEGRCDAHGHTCKFRRKIRRGVLGTHKGGLWTVPVGRARFDLGGDLRDREGGSVDGMQERFPETDNEADPDSGQAGGRAAADRCTNLEAGMCADGNLYFSLEANQKERKKDKEKENRLKGRCNSHVHVSWRSIKRIITDLTALRHDMYRWSEAVDRWLSGVVSQWHKATEKHSRDDKMIRNRG